MKSILLNATLSTKQTILECVCVHYCVQLMSLELAPSEIFDIISVIYDSRKAYTSESNTDPL